MAKTIEINHGVMPFDDQVDTSRNNPDRKPWGKGDNDFRLREEYDPPSPPEESPKEPTPPEPPPDQKFTHKLSNGIVLEADSVEALAAKIEKATLGVSDLKWDESPAYQPMEFKPRDLSVQEQAMLLNQWGQNPQQVIRAIQEAEYGAPMAKIIERFNRNEIREMQRKQEEAGVEFLEEVAETYNPTPANAKKLTKFLEDNKKPITKNNLIKAFKELSAADPKLLRTPEAEEVEEGNEPPAILQSNQGLPPQAAPAGVDMDKFSRMSLTEMQAFFQKVRTRR